MAIRFPEVYPEEKEIISPDDWNRNLAEFVDEVNGRIDSDNLLDRESIDETMVFARAFQRLFQDGGKGPTFLLNNGFVGWQTLDSSGTSLPAVEFEADADGWVICEANATWEWLGNGVHRDEAEDGDGDMEEDESKNPFVGRAHENYQRGVANQDRPPGGWMGTSRGLVATRADAFGDNGYENAVEHASGSPVTFLMDESFGAPTGTTIFVGMQHGNFPQGWWEDLAVDYYAFKLRIVIDGNPVSESGWIHVGNYQCGTFICGAAPISAGFHKIELQARAALLADLHAHRKGLGVKYRSGTKRGKHTSRFSTTTSAAPTPMPVRDRDFGLDCRVKDRNLIVSYRKH